MAMMTVEQGKCEIYPSTQEQLCMRVRVLVLPLQPSDAAQGEWVGGDEHLREIEVRCSQRGLERLLGAIDKATKPPTPRPRKAKTDA